MLGLKKRKGVDEGQTNKTKNKKEKASIEKKQKYEMSKIDKKRKPEIEQKVSSEIEQEDPNLKAKDNKAYKKRVKEEVNRRLLLHNETLSRVAPPGNIRFKDIDFINNGKFCTILTFSVKKGSFKNLPPLWGMGLVPKIENTEDFRNKDIITKTIYSISRRSDAWAERKIQDSTTVAETGYSEAKTASQTVHKKLFEEHYIDTNTIAEELKNGSSYLDLSIRVTIKAQTRDDLYNAIFYLEKHYSKHFNNKVDLVPFAGEMKTEYQNLLDSAKKQRGENYHLTSRELAGSYPFVSSGVNDINGSYIGQLYGELNNDPVLLDTMNFKKLAVICAKNRASDINSVANRTKYNFNATTAWSNKITQDAMMNGNKVVEYVLNTEHVERMREELLSETAHIDLLKERVAINMFEPFARGRDNMSAWGMLVAKVQEIARQFSEKEDTNDNTTIKSDDIDELGSIMESFYIEEGLWKDNPEERKKDLRLNNLRHNEYPRLEEFDFYLNSILTDEELNVSKNGTTARVKSLRKLSKVFGKIKSRSSSLFNRHTTISENYLKDKSKIIFDFKTLRETHHAALMGSFVNTLAYGEQELNEDDVLIIHGADELTESVKKHLKTRIGHLNNRGIKVVLMYNDADVLFQEKNTVDNSTENLHRVWFRNADMRITNSMQPQNVKRYGDVIKQKLPESVISGMQSNSDHIYYLNRDNMSTLFKLEIAD
ncbi:hypothetical protein [Mammaliicoccus vitulinus]|uniref:hypothetical protein n=1 Tax=Mammaliicoccus vitulinus TaxID=71237 RepID=UPI00248B1975|nr:hypothetical protein [Mammaliicoccus vitulinus]